MSSQLSVLFLTTEWPTAEHPTSVPFLVQYADALRAQGVQVDVFHFQGKGNPLNYLRAWVNVRKFPAWKNSDLIHAQWGQSAILALFSRKTLVITFHGSDLQGIMGPNGHYNLKGKLLIALNKLLAHHANRCIAVSQRLKDLLPDYCQSIEVIPMGISLDIFHPMDKNDCKGKLGLDENYRHILFVSDPSRPEKRFALAKEAVLAASVPNVKLLVVSGQPYEKIPLYLNAGDMLLLTSSHEGSPVIIKEALACNLPVVAVDVGDVREKLEKVHGCVVCSDDRVQTIAEAIRQILANDTLINGRDAVQDLAWPLIAQHTLAVYHHCLDDTCFS